MHMVHVQILKPNGATCVYFQTMTKTPVKFRNYRYQAVGGVAPTRYPLSIHIFIDNAQKIAKFNLRKK